MPRVDDLFPSLFEALQGQYGRPATSPIAVDPFEALLRTPLERMLDSKKVASVLDVLREDGFLDPQTLAEADPSEVSDSLRNAGLNVPDKALLPLRKLARWLTELHQGDTDALVGDDSDVSSSQLREELLSLNGIGPATADAVLLFSLNRPSFPLDRATYRILVRHGWTDTTADYDEARDVVERLAPDDPAILKALATWFEKVGADFCRTTVAKCEKCPLRTFLPDGGPIDPLA